MPKQKIVMPSFNDSGRGVGLVNAQDNNIKTQNMLSKELPTALATEEGYKQHAKVIAEALKENPDMAKAFQALSGHIMLPELMATQDPEVMSQGPESSSEIRADQGMTMERLKALAKAASQ